MSYIKYEVAPGSIAQFGKQSVNNFTIGVENIDLNTVNAFGDEWAKFDYFSEREIEAIATEHYFDIVNLDWIKGKRVLDVGCGTGRWTKYVAKYAITVDAIDPSKAIEVAAVLLKDCDNVRLSRASVTSLPFANESFDFVFSLGVLHHIPNTQLAMQRCMEKLKSNGYFLTYLYYRFDNRGPIFKALFKLSDLFRKMICRLPAPIKNFVCDCIGILVYYPLILLATFIKNIGLEKIAKKMPLHFYIGKTLNVIRNDARDRFGTPLEQRFTKNEIFVMMQNSGLTDIVFSENETYWHAVGRKK